MTTVSSRAILDRTQLLAGLSEDWRRRLAESSHLVRLSAGQVVFREGNDVPGLYCVGSGLVRVVKEGPTGKQLVLHFAQPGSTFGEVAVFGNFRAPATAEAVEDTVCAVVATAQLRGLLETHHDLCLQLLGASAHWVRSLVGRLEDIVLRDASARVARYLLDAAPPSNAAPFSLPVLKKDLASHLNLTQETLSRTLRKLVDAGLIVSEPDGTVRLLDGESLAKVAGVEI